MSAFVPVPTSPYSLLPRNWRKPRSACRRPYRPLCTLTPTEDPASSPSPKSADLHSNASSFQHWAQSVQISMPSLALSTISAPHLHFRPLRGLIATADIAANETLVRVPRSAALQVTSLPSDDPPAQFPLDRQTWRRCPWYVRLALKLLALQRDASHPLHPWANMMPPASDMPHNWSTADLEELQLERLIQSIRSQRRDLQNQYNLVVSSLPGKGKTLSFERFSYAVDVVRSRTFSGPQEAAPFKQRVRQGAFIAANTLLWPTLGVIPWQNALNGGLTALFGLAAYDILLPYIMRFSAGMTIQRYVMTPAIDMLNHVGEPRLSRAGVEFLYFEDSFCIRAANKYVAGDQVFSWYGPQPNDVLLQYYGFVAGRNVDDTYVFPADVARELGVARLSVGWGGFPREIVQKVGRLADDDRDRAVTLLKEVCRTELTRFATDISKDEELLQSALGKMTSEGDASVERLVWAITLRKAKKSLLSWVATDWNGEDAAQVDRVPVATEVLR